MILARNTAASSARLAASCGLALALVSTAFLFPGTASGQEVEQSPRSNAMELRFGFFDPAIDDEFSGDTKPFEQAFGSDSAWMLGAEIDFQFWQGFGSLGVFGMTGYGQITGKGITEEGERSSDETSMLFFPFTAGLVYRFDVLATRFGVPLALSLKGGVDYWIWQVEDGNEETSSYAADDGSSVDGLGGTYGLYGSVGLHLLLDFFEPHAATIFDNDLGVNNSYLFVEWSAHWLNDFGSDSSFDLSHGGLVFGLAFEM